MYIFSYGEGRKELWEDCIKSQEEYVKYDETMFKSYKKLLKKSMDAVNQLKTQNAPKSTIDNRFLQEIYCNEQRERKSLQRFINKE